MSSSTERIQGQLDLARGTTLRLTSDPAADWFPVWSPDGSRVVFTSNRAGLADLYQKAASGTGSDVPAHRE